MQKDLKTEMEGLLDKTIHTPTDPLGEDANIEAFHKDGPFHESYGTIDMKTS